MARYYKTGKLHKVAIVGNNKNNLLAKSDILFRLAKQIPINRYFQY
jgi:hypothetical protein